MTALFLIEKNVKSLVDMSTAVDVVQEAFLQWADGRAMNVSRRRAKAPGIVLHSLCAGAEYLGYVGWKNYTTTKHGAKFHVAIYDNETGEMAAFIKADYLGQLRTGAASGVATAAMARPESRTVGLFGTGGQARTITLIASKLRDGGSTILRSMPIFRTIIAVHHFVPF